MVKCRSERIEQMQGREPAAVIPAGRRGSCANIRWIRRETWIAKEDKASEELRVNVSSSFFPGR